MSNVSLAGVHFYGGSGGASDPNALPDFSAPAGQRGWNVEYLRRADTRDQDVIDKATRAKNDGLRNIIRIDFVPNQAIPTSCANAGGPSNECWGWSYNVMSRIQDFQGLADVFVIGNEPNIEGAITPAQYAAAFNHLYTARKASLPSATRLVVAGPAQGAPNPGTIYHDWLRQTTALIGQADGFALHAYGAPNTPGCGDPRQTCTAKGWEIQPGLRLDGGFMVFKQYIEQQINSKFYGQNLPVYITEFNSADDGVAPASDYPTGWINKAFEAVRSYNATRGNKPEVQALAWFVDEDRGGWSTYSLRNSGSDRLRQAYQNMKAEFHNPANGSGGTGGGGTPTGPAGYAYCSAEGQNCNFSGTKQVAFGANGAFYTKTLTGGTACTTAVFGDPIFGTPKSCFTKDVSGGGGSNCGFLNVNQSFGVGGSVASCDGSVSLVLQGDGNLVAYSGGRALWSSGTYGQAAKTLVMQGDGNLVLYSTSGAALWNTRTGGHAGATLTVQNDGNLIVSQNGSVLWSSNSHK